ncbi:MAG: hypothetical protein MHM6MM_001304 [Cercozoa sp. M6MM]
MEVETTVTTETVRSTQASSAHRLPQRDDDHSLLACALREAHSTRLVQVNVSSSSVEFKQRSQQDDDDFALRFNCDLQKRDRTAVAQRKRHEEAKRSLAAAAEKRMEKIKLRSEATEELDATNVSDSVADSTHTTTEAARDDEPSVAPEEDENSPFHQDMQPSALVTDFALAPATTESVRKLIDNAKDQQLGLMHKYCRTLPAEYQTQPGRYALPPLWKQPEMSSILVSFDTICMGTTRQIEPFFLSASLFDTNTQQRVSEWFHTDSLNDESTLTGDLNVMRSLSTPVTRSRTAIFKVAERRPEIILVVRVERVLQGDNDAASKPYLSQRELEKLGNPKELDKLSNKARETISRLVKWRTSFAWCFQRLFDAEGNLQPSNASLGGSLGAAAEQSSDPLLAPRAYEIPQLFYQKEPESEYDFACRVSQCANDPSVLRKQKQFPTAWLRLAARYLERDMPQHRVDGQCIPLSLPPSASPVQLDEDEVAREVMELQEERRVLSPHLRQYRHQLLVRPISVGFAGKYRNIAVSVEFRQNDETSVDADRAGLPVLLSRGSGAELVPQQRTSVAYHNKNPSWNDEFKVLLPTNLTEHSHLLFRFTKVSCKSAKKHGHELIGAALIPLVERGGLIRSGQHQLPVATELRERYKLAYQRRELQFYHQGRELFDVEIVVDSTVMCNDIGVVEFSTGFPGDPEIQRSPQAHLLLRDCADAIRKASSERCVEFLAPLLDHLLALCAQRQTEPAVLCAFDAVLSVAKKVSAFEPSDRAFLPPRLRGAGCQTHLASYVSNLYGWQVPLAKERAMYTRLAGAYLQLLRWELHKVLRARLAGEDPRLGHMVDLVQASTLTFDLIVKSLALDREQVSAQSHRERQLTLRPLMERVLFVLGVVIGTFGRLGFPTLPLKGANLSVALFLSDIMRVVDRAVVVALMRAYLGGFSSSLEQVMDRFSSLADTSVDLRKLLDETHQLPLEIFKQSTDALVQEEFWRDLEECMEDTQSLTRDSQAIEFGIEFWKTFLTAYSAKEFVRWHQSTETVKLLENSTVRDQWQRDFPLAFYFCQFCVKNIGSSHVVSTQNQHALIDLVRFAMLRADVDDSVAEPALHTAACNLFFPLILLFDDCSQHDTWDHQAQRNFQIIILQLLRHADRQLIRSYLVRLHEQGQAASFLAFLIKTLGLFDYRGANDSTSFSSVALKSNLSPEALQSLLFQNDGSSMQTASSLKTELESLSLVNLRGTIGRQRGVSLRRLRREQQQSLRGRPDALGSTDASSGGGRASSARTRTWKRGSKFKGGNTLKKMSGDAISDVTMAEAQLAACVQRTVLRVLVDFREDIEAELRACRPRVQPEASAVDFGSDAGSVQVALQLLSLCVELLKVNAPDAVLMDTYPAVKLVLSTCAKLFFGFQVFYPTMRELVRQAVRHCSFVNPNTRSMAASLLYSVAKLCQIELRSLVLFEDAVTLCLADDVLSMYGYSLHYLQQSLQSVELFREQDKDSALRNAQIRFEYKQALSAVMRKVVTIFDDARAILKQELLAADRADPAKLQELIVAMTQTYQHLPDVRVAWLRNLARHHHTAQNFPEEAQCWLEIADLAEQSMRAASAPVVAEATQPTSPVARRQAKKGPPVASKLTEDPEDVLVMALQRACDAFEAANMLETVDATYARILPLYRRRGALKEMSRSFGTLQAVFDRLIGSLRSIEQAGQQAPVGCAACHDARTSLASYYRVSFFGERFGAENGVEYIYSVPGLTRLSEITSDLRSRYSKQLGVPVRVLGSSARFDPTTLKEDEHVLQITYVKPYFADEDCIDEDFAPFFASWRPRPWLASCTKLSAFSFSTPFTQQANGRAHAADVTQQYMRRTVMRVEHEFPYLQTRQRVVTREEHELDPIDAAVANLDSQVRRLVSLLKDPLCDTKVLTSLLSGSLLLQVNGGTKEIAELFWRQEKGEPIFDVDRLKVLRASIRRFLDAIQEGVAAYKKHSGATPELLHEYESSFSSLSATVMRIVKSGGRRKARFE